MKKRLFSLMLAMLMVFTMLPASVFAAESPVAVTVAGTEHHTYAAQVFDLVNEARTDSGLAAVTRNATLSELAAQRAAEIALYFSHTRPDGSEVSTVIDGVYTGWTIFGENIAIGQTSPDAVMESWMNSDGHRENILTADYTQIGIGCYYAGGVYCWVQIFGNSTSNTAETTQTGTEYAYTEVNILPSLLTLSPTGSDSVTLEVGDSTSVLLTSTNPEFTSCTPGLVPSLTCSNANVVSWTISHNGTVTITADSSGTATLTFPAYDGEASPYTLEITIPGDAPPATSEPEETEPPATSEPEETEPSQPTQPPVTDPDAIASGVCGDNAYWVLDKDGVLTVSGTGPMYNGSSSQVPWDDYQDQILHAVIEDGITTICDYAFFLNKSIRSLTIADSVTELGYRFCEGCTSLASVTLPASLTEIPFSAFMNTALTEVIIPDGVAYIDDYAFRGCTELLAITIPDTVTGIHGTALDNCPNLTVYAYYLSYAHLDALSRELPVMILEEKPDTVFYTIYTKVNRGGTVTVAPESSPANRFVIMELIPEDGWYLDSAYYYTNSEEQIELQFEQISDTEIIFFMPECEVGFEITFIMTKSPFSDVKESEFYYEPVLWAVSTDVTAGISSTRFAPNNPCTRAQVVTFLWRVAGKPEPVSSVNPFVDVHKSDYYYNAVLWAVENGITAGMDATHFGPNRACTRAQVVTFLWRALSGEDYSYAYNPFVDVTSDSYYYSAVLWAMNYGITAGVDSTHFAPNSTCTRGQIVTFLYRTFHG